MFYETLSEKPYLHGTNKGSSRVPRRRTFYGLVKYLFLECSLFDAHSHPQDGAKSTIEVLNVLCIEKLFSNKGTFSSVNREFKGKVCQSIELDELVTVVTAIFPHRAFL